MDHICHLYIWRWLHSVQWIWVTWLHSDWTSLIKRPSCGKFSVSEVFQSLKMKKDFCINLCSLWVQSTLYFYMSFLFANTPWVNHRLNRSREISLTDVIINFLYMACYPTLGRKSCQNGVRAKDEFCTNQYIFSTSDW